LERRSRAESSFLQYIAAEAMANEVRQCHAANFKLSRHAKEPAGPGTGLEFHLLMASMLLLVACSLWYVRHRRAQRLVAELWEQDTLTAPCTDTKSSSVCKLVAGQGLGVDFGFTVLDSEMACGTSRLVKIQCPGVEHQDVEVEQLFNGCQVKICRRASDGVEATMWTKRFEFSPKDGLFEFKEDQMRLENGFLQLVFRSYTVQTRVVRFPQHFALAATDADQWWEYPEGDDYSIPQVLHRQDCQHKTSEVPCGLDVCTESTASTFGTELSV